MQRMLGIHVVIVAFLGIAMSSARAGMPEPNVAVFDVDGLTLSMPIDVFRQLYPEAEVTERTMARYCYGKEFKIDSLSSLSAVVRRGNTTVHTSFDYKVFGQGILTIKRDEVINFDPSRFSSLRDRLVQQYGPFTRLKYPSKMDPAGLVVGFEWEQKGVAYLSVTIHRDHTDESGAIRQTTFLTRSLPGMKNQSLAAAYYRDAVQNFRKKCSSR
jgi:hypothetical protein